MSAKARRVLISGAGVAGPTLAFWLLRKGFVPVIVERAPAFRSGGYILDFWGVGFDVAERMGLLNDLTALGYRNDYAAFVDRTGRTRSRFGGEALRRALDGRFLSILRGDLAAAIYKRVEGQIETVFGDEVTEIRSHDTRTEVAFRKGASRDFDIVIGADGLHSGIRALAFDEHAQPLRYLGYCAAVFTTKGYSRRDEHVYLSFAAPGRQIARFTLRDDRTGFLFVFTRPDADLSALRDVAAQKHLLRTTFGQDRWREWPEIAMHLERCDDLYFDSVSQVDLPCWSKGRVALVGDAAYCPSLLAGEGAAFAMAGAYILANELARTEEPLHAFAAYERKFRPFILGKQKSARSFASSFTPKTELGLSVRDVVLNLGAIPAIGDFLLRYFVADNYRLPNYESGVSEPVPN